MTILDIGKQIRVSVFQSIPGPYYVARLRTPSTVQEPIGVSLEESMMIRLCSSKIDLTLSMS
jgi:hypothetical protein